jgi:cell division protein ZapA (FtsZ GTPase activity inhibitor)
MPKTELRIDVLGTSLLLSVEEDPLYLDTLLSRYRRLLENTQKAYGLRDALQVSVLTGFLICDELERLRIKSMSDMAAYEAVQAEKITLDMIEKIEKAIPADFDGNTDADI